MSQKVKYKIPVKVPFIFRVIHAVFPLLEKMAPYLANRLTARVFFRPMRFKSPQEEKEAANQGTVKIIRSGNNKVQVYIWGDGPTTILMTHGWSGRGTQFRKFIQPFLKAGLRIIAFDGPAHGNSSGQKTDVTEFYEVIKELATDYSPFEAAIGHSFGGVANQFTASQGIKIPKQILISSPTIADDIINETVRKLNGSVARGQYLKKYIFRKYGVHFEEVSILKLVETLDNVSILAIHDQNDKEVSLEHPNALLRKYPHSKLITTQGLGHIRILKSPEVIQYCLEFIKSDKKVVVS